MKADFFDRLAAGINALLGISAGHFGRSPRKEPGAGVIRARERIERHRAEQRERLKDAPPPKVTRQQIRSVSIRGR